MIKRIYQQNEPNSISFNFIPKVNVKISNLWFGTVRSSHFDFFDLFAANCEQHAPHIRKSASFVPVLPNSQNPIL